VEVAGPSGDSAPTAPLTGPIASIAALGSQVRTDEQNAPASAGYASAHTVAGADSTLTALLRSEPAAAVQATVLTSQRLLLPKGAFIDCTLETAIDSTLPGMTTCVTATDTFGVDGKVVLLERGTKLVGETRGQVQQGSARVFVIWTEARTPTGVIVPLESPGTDQLGRSGLAGEVDRHFWDRFGAAILISTIDGAVQAAVESGTRTGATTIINPTSVPDVMTETLKSTLNIPPTIVKHNGDRIQILVARDIDFRGVYELRAAADAR
jgi:type IV secretion system protein VirB10